jgi:hypothetical protein
MRMSYEDVLLKAGYDVVAYEEFGSYQGEWAAILVDGGVILGDYGSCSGCDPLEATIPWDSDKRAKWWTEENCKNFCEEMEYAARKDYDQLLIDSKWNSDFNARNAWLREQLTEMGYTLSKEE